MTILDDFFSKYPVKAYKKGSIILLQDMPPQTAYAVKKGVVKTYNLTTHGGEKPISFNLRGDIFPVGWIFGKIRLTQYYYEAFSDCELYTVPPEDYIAFLKKNPKALFEALDQNISDLLNYQLRINALGQSSARSKVVHTVHFLALHFGHDLSPDVVKIPLPLTQQDLANFMGLTRETIVAELKKLAEQKIIFYQKKTYVVHTDKLNELLDDEYDRRLVR